MALVPCPECQKEVSTEAIACPQCAFPNPGKNSFFSSTSTSQQQVCPECGHSVSKQAQVCHFCGISLRGDRNGNSVVEGSEGGDTIDETWLCPHCGTPYTRKVKRGVVALESSIDKSPAISHPTSLPHSRQPDSRKEMANFGGSNGPLARRRPALWQDPLMTAKEIDTNVPRFPRSRKKSIILIIVGILLTMVAGGLGALWQFKGITPLELLAYLPM